MDWHRGDTILCMELNNEVEIGWSPNLHLKLLTLADEMNSFKMEVSHLGKMHIRDDMTKVQYLLAQDVIKSCYIQLNSNVTTTITKSVDNISSL